MTRFLSQNIFLSCLVGITCISSNAHAHDRDHEWHREYPPAYQREIVRNFNYIYYPSQQVYYSPEYRTWYWSDGRGWQLSNQLPYGLNIDMRFGGVPIVLRSPQPYLEHVYVERAYGQPWRENHMQYGHHYREWREGGEHYRRDRW